MKIRLDQAMQEEKAYQFELAQRIREITDAPVNPNEIFKRKEQTEKVEKMLKRKQ